ncbi:TatD family hydrolase [Marinicella meishanensis]|uniref:TatD family hydrolase n=1 Tax=Marinicella meishanensis TaxID=2873263 RepID=UPI001CC015D1|nr:TatD family hydrolase [Marinicella sp. NBU2979]
MIELIDSHIHLDDPRFDLDREELVKLAHISGVQRFVVPAVSRQRFAAVEQLANSHPAIVHTLGLHPYYIDQHSGADLEQLAAAIPVSQAVGIGECGLDHFLKNLDKKKQRLVFEAQVVLAKHFNLPLILHVRGAVAEVFDVLRQHDYFQAVMHSFNGSIEQAKQITDCGVLLGFGPAVCNPKASKLQALVRAVDPQHMLLETDAPDQPFYDRHGKRNLPIDLLRVNQDIAAIKDIDPMQLATQTSDNARRLFGL